VPQPIAKRKPTWAEQLNFDTTIESLRYSGATGEALLRITATAPLVIYFSLFEFLSRHVWRKHNSTLLRPLDASLLQHLPDRWRFATAYLYNDYSFATMQSGSISNFYIPESTNMALKPIFQPISKAPDNTAKKWKTVSYSSWIYGGYNRDDQIYVDVIDKTVNFYRERSSGTTSLPYDPEISWMVDFLLWLRYPQYYQKPEEWIFTWVRSHIIDADIVKEPEGFEHPIYLPDWTMPPELEAEVKSLIGSRS